MGIRNALLVCCIINFVYFIRGNACNNQIVQGRVKVGFGLVIAILIGAFKGCTMIFE